jgi:general secretion pathway protein B
MSLILEALRKSEIERQRGQTPTVFTPVLHQSYSSHSSFKHKLPWILLGVFALGTIGVAAWLANTRNVSTTAATAADAQDLPIATEAVTQTAPAVVDKPAPVANTKPLVNTATQPAVDAEMPAGSLPAQSPAPPVALPAVPDTENAVAPMISQDDALPIAVLSSELRQQLPPMKFTMHVYSDSPRDRFAIVDGARITEGSLLGPAVVSEIRRDGLVIEWSGSRYLVAKP